MVSEPFSDLRFVPLARGDRKHHLSSFIRERSHLPSPAIDLYEHAQADPRSPLVAIWERVVLRQTHDQNRRLVYEVWENSASPNPAAGA